ncbi:MAG: branched-chain amino acid aminotransferase [Oscillospiraceae bacterium]|jgi:branched-chain amino acid aminotransferase|nr:branched-chain amino acid aminotransferase [Oscillospiraceae bacterium]
MQAITVQRTAAPKEKPDFSRLGFGQYFTDHMFLLHYTEGTGWHTPRIVPYGPLSLDPASMVLHYGQETFEGLKAYRADDGRTLLFRPLENIRRMNRSNRRLQIAEIDETLYLEAIKALVRADIDWVPTHPDTSLYIRPFIIATDPYLGVRASHTYQFLIILSPVGAYYPEGIDPVSILIETEDVRAVKGGTGEAKTGGNYAATIRAQVRAKEKGYTQVLWLDGVHRRYIEEVGTMNVFFSIDGRVVTPPLEGSILPGVTRDSAIRLLTSWGVPVDQRVIAIDELVEAAGAGRLSESFGTGTAAVISPIGSFNYNEQIIPVSGGQIGPLARRLYDELTGIQWGKKADPFGWTVEI